MQKLFNMLFSVEHGQKKNSSYCVGFNLTVSKYNQNGNVLKAIM
ncbi:conserved hypothetical protein [Trichinella spiralis]|nr:conserved hypothetical protein [Trichinella spiralis]